MFGGVLQGRGSLVVLAWCGHVHWVRAAGIGDRIELFQPDRIHPTEQAQPLMLDNVWPALARLLGAK